jgi:hypothetical protein
MSRALCRTSSNSKNVKGMPKSLGSVKRSKQHVATHNTLKMLEHWKCYGLQKSCWFINDIIRMTLGSTNEVWAMLKKPITK